MNDSHNTAENDADEEFIIFSVERATRESRLYLIMMWLFSCTENDLIV